MSDYEIVLRFKSRGLALRLLGRACQWGYEVTRITDGDPEQYEIGHKDE